MEKDEGKHLNIRMLLVFANLSSMLFTQLIF